MWIIIKIQPLLRFLNLYQYYPKWFYKLLEQSKLLCFI